MDTDKCCGDLARDCIAVPSVDPRSPTRGPAVAAGRVSAQARTQGPGRGVSAGLTCAERGLRGLPASVRVSVSCGRPDGVLRREPRPGRCSPGPARCPHTLKQTLGLAPGGPRGAACPHRAPARRPCPALLGEFQLRSPRSPCSWNLDRDTGSAAGSVAGGDESPGFRQVNADGLGCETSVTGTGPFNAVHGSGTVCGAGLGLGCVRRVGETQQALLDSDPGLGQAARGRGGRGEFVQSGWAGPGWDPALQRWQWRGRAECPGAELEDPPGCRGGSSHAGQGS